MGASPTPVIEKKDLPKEIWKVASTLSEEAQRAAIKKVRELQFDAEKGRLSLEETMINMAHGRDVLLDAVEREKLVQLPLKVQYALCSQVTKVGDALGQLLGGTDAILSLEDSVEELITTIWQFNLHNLSGEVLGFQKKINQLKEQETLIRRVHRQAVDLETAQQQGKSSLQKLEEMAVAGADLTGSIRARAEDLDSILTKASDHEQKIAALSAQTQQHDNTVAQFLASAKTAAADTEAIASKVKSLQTEIEATRSTLNELEKDGRQIIDDTEGKLEEALRGFDEKSEAMRAGSEASLAALQSKAETSIQEMETASQANVEKLVRDSEERLNELDTELKQIWKETYDGLVAKQAENDNQLSSHLQSFQQKGEVLIKQLQESAKGLATVQKGEFDRLVSELDDLEGRIRKSIERATGYTLFHSFQKRQMDIAASKRFWGYALAAAVGVSLVASGIFIWSLQFVTEYNAAFYLKLSISLPLIYAIAFCSVQYSRERRLEEEYAFKSNISISLEPYQKLVEQLVDKEKPEERAQYAAFIINSVSKVFTSPTDRIFDDHSKEKAPADKVIKAVGEIIEPLSKALKK